MGMFKNKEPCNTEIYKWQKTEIILKFSDLWV